MGIEIDFLPVGDGEERRAIALRFGNLFGPPNEQVVMVIDGGTQKSGSGLCGRVSRPTTALPRSTLSCRRTRMPTTQAGSAWSWKRWLSANFGCTGQ